MTQKTISGGTIHDLPVDLSRSLTQDKNVLQRWEDLTPLARNEWICWTVSVKMPETRKKHIERTVEELMKGKRRPCCWMGCVHRPDKPISPSVQWVINKRTKTVTP